MKVLAAIACAASMLLLPVSAVFALGPAFSGIAATADSAETVVSNPAGMTRFNEPAVYGNPMIIYTKSSTEITACAVANPKVAKKTPPQVLFRRFAPSSFGFELRVWVIDADHRLQVISELHQEIDRRFRKANIQMAFPQHDVHLDTARALKVSLVPETVFPGLEQSVDRSRPVVEGI